MTRNYIVPIIVLTIDVSYWAICCVHGTVLSPLHKPFHLTLCNTNWKWSQSSTLPLQHLRQYDFVEISNQRWNQFIYPLNLSVIMWFAWINTMQWKWLCEALEDHKHGHFLSWTPTTRRTRVVYSWTMEHRWAIPIEAIQPSQIQLTNQLFKDA